MENYDEDIHRTNDDDFDESNSIDQTELSDDELDELSGDDYLVEETEEIKEGKQNYVAGVPADEDLIFEPVAGVRSKKNLKSLAFLAIPLVIFLFIAAVFLFKGNNGGKTAVVRDNGSQLGINASVDGQVPDFADDYKDRYDQNSNSTGDNFNSNSAPGTPDGRFERVGSDITSLPNDPNITAPAPVTVVPVTSSGGGGGSRTTSGGNSGGGVPNDPVIERAPAQVTRISPDSQTVVVDESSLNRTEREPRSANGFKRERAIYFYQPPSQVNGRGTISAIKNADSAYPKPDFGTIFPVRILGRIHTLGTNGFARMELTRTIDIGSRSIPRGTMFIGRIAGSENDRLFVSVLGYIDAPTNRLVKISGDVQGGDGALGVRGDVRRIGSRWKKFFGETLEIVKEIGSAYLLGRGGGGGSIINTGGAARIPDHLSGDERTKYVVVEAGSSAYVVVTDLPPAAETASQIPRTGLSDDEILQMLDADSDAELRGIMPNLSREGQRIARQSLDR